MQLEAARTYAIKHLSDGPKTIVNNSLVDVSEITKDKQTVLAGAISICAGKEVKEFEWNSKSVNNKMFAIFERQLGAYQQYDDVTTDQFGVFLLPWLRERAQIFCKIYDHKKRLMDYPQSKTDWSQSKREKYAANI